MSSEGYVSSSRSVAQSDVTKALAAKESAEQMHGMDELYNQMRKRPLIIKAYDMGDSQCPLNDKNKDSNSRPRNVKTVHFVRHGQAFHNLMADHYTALGREWTQFTIEPNNPYTIPELADAPLTDKGRQQAYVLQQQVMSLENPPDLIALSPLCRALQTGVIAFENLIGKSLFLAHEMTREEIGVHMCDKRRPVSRLLAEFPQVHFSLLEDEHDLLFSETHRESKAEIGERIYKFMEWLSTRQEKHIAVASHSGWLFAVFNAVVECDDGLKSWFWTGEMRSVVLEFIKKD